MVTPDDFYDFIDNIGDAPFTVPGKPEIKCLADIKTDSFRNSIYPQYRAPFYKKAYGFDPPPWILTSKLKLLPGKIHRKLKIEWWRPKFDEKTIHLPHHEGVPPERIEKLIKSHIGKAYALRLTFSEEVEPKLLSTSLYLPSVEKERKKRKSEAFRYRRPKGIKGKKRKLFGK